MPTMTEVFVLREEDGRLQDRAHLWNVFSKSFPEFKYRINQAADRLFGRGWKQRVCQAAAASAEEFGGSSDWDPAKIDTAIRKFWDRFYTDHETIVELSGLYDLMQDQPEGIEYVLDNCLLKVQGGPSPAVDINSDYRSSGEYGTPEYRPGRYDPVERTKRPLGLKKGTKDQLAYSKEEL